MSAEERPVKMVSLYALVVLQRVFFHGDPDTMPNMQEKFEMIATSLFL